MGEFKFITTSSPHIHSGESVQKIMFNVAGALLLPTAAGIYFFGMRALVLVIITTLAAVLTEAIFQKLRGKPITVWDGSAMVTGILLALNLPPGLPLWMAVVGAAIAISLGKQVYGGLGMNPFNPALIGRVFLMITFPVQMTTWINPVDGTTGATPLQIMKMQGVSTDYVKLFLGNIGGSLGETSALMIILGGLYLLYKGYIEWRIPGFYLGAVAILSVILGRDPIFELLSGGLMLGAFFMATDMVTSPISRLGKIIFGIGAGIFTVIIRFYGGYPEGVSFSILLMNAFTPVINRYTVPRIYGEVKVR
ncbi:RnfABCDGE type electron transport complex subunit D [Biomaibacter acetigenes]|jgi:electron transport complex protein RnfD|uniref:Ion-translocating oxidoreductase complex subunit D n=1 Tax=Biomaibacter acetigenes TaxID=2316383 RepID=A0A3G2R635_9FIRM|nr:RnfABCDGE type electron transport complex subunit D [Biomaibacter acetigenes]AYO31024.1 RnfABCDGE type electron transport complex subunit D [Biomaibacter acetigenes]RKL63903.1 RnfABCDGE type electron transport complex subunit D [Thermoanaerobacteraceae bacterium SP2]